MSGDSVRVTQNVRTEDGYLFWKGQVFPVMSTPSRYGVEVKAAGEYVVIPVGCFEVV